MMDNIREKLVELIEESRISCGENGVRINGSRDIADHLIANGVTVKVKKEKHCFYQRDWFIFPIAIEWQRELPFISPTTKRLFIHFLWWHWRWTFVKGA